MPKTPRPAPPVVDATKADEGRAVPAAAVSGFGFGAAGGGRVVGELGHS
jgi:hypothetical protein